MDLIKTVTTGTRVATTVNRVATLSKAGVSPKTIASQMTDNSAKGHKYTVNDVKTLQKLYDDAKSSVLVTKAQANALLKDQEIHGLSTQTA